MSNFSSPFMAKSPLDKRVDGIVNSSLQTGMLVPPDGSKLQRAIDDGNLKNLSTKERRQAQREYNKSVRKYNRENDTNLSRLKRYKSPGKMEQEIDEDARADANKGYTQWRNDTMKATGKPVPDSEESLKKFKNWKAAQEANKKENDTIKKG